jgi:hypothetical protein
MPSQLSHKTESFVPSTSSHGNFQYMSLTVTQWIAFSVALIFLIQGAYSGYKRGPIRQCAGIVALIVAVAVGWIFGGELGLLFLNDTIVPWLLRGPIGVIGLSALTWLLALSWLWFVGRRAKGAEETESPVLGALVGCWTGFMNCAFLLAVLTAWAGAREILSPATIAQQHWAVAARDDLSAIAGMDWVKGYSPWPESWKRIVRKGHQVLSSPEASRRLMEQEPIRALASHPTFYTAWGDPEVKRLAHNGSLGDLLEHPKVRPLLNDAAFQQQLIHTDLEVLLDKSLKLVNTK